MRTFAIALVVALPGCAWLRGPVVCPPAPEPPPALLAVPPALPPIPLDLPPRAPR